MVYGGSNILGGSGASVLWGTEYTLFSSSKTQDQKVETNYDPANGTQFSTTTTINYSSPFHHQPTQKTIVNSANVPVTSNMQYAFDYRIASADALTDSYNYYINTVATAQNNLNSYTYCSPQDGTTNNCLWIAYTNFRITKAQARNVYVQSRQNLSSSFAGIHSSIKGSADTELKPLLELQDEYDNALIETSNWKNGNLLSSTFVRYDYFSNPNNIVYPQRTQTINLSVPSSGFTPSATSGSGTSLTKDSRYTDETIFNFNAGNIADITKKDGVTTAYIWGYNNQFPVAKITGSSYANAIGYVNQTNVNNPSTSDATMRSALSGLYSIPGSLVNTYTYAPAIGMTSETNARGFINTYEYDALGRLLRSRDKDGNILKQMSYAYEATNTGGSPATFNMAVTDNNGSYTGYTIVLTSVSGGASQTYVVNSYGSNSGFNVVPGVYNIAIYPPPADSGGLFCMLSVSGSSTLYSSGSTASFNGVTLGAGNYNTINIY